MATFGNILNGANNVSAPPSGNKAVSKFTLDRRGTVDHVLFGFFGSISSCVAVIYDDTGVGGLPGALLGVSSSVSGSGATAFPFSGLTLNAGNYWVGVQAATGTTAHCQSATNGIAFNANSGSPSNPFGASPSLANFVYPEVIFYTPVLTAGTAYGDLLGGDDLGHNYVANNVIVLKTTLPAGSISKLTTFLQNSYSGAKCKGVVYDASGAGGTPGTLIGSTTELVSPAINGNDLTFSSPLTVTAGDYYIGLITDTTLAVFHNDALSTANAVGSATYTSGPPGTFPTPTTGNGSWCLWATLAAAGGGVAPFNPPLLGGVRNLGGRFQG